MSDHRPIGFISTVAKVLEQILLPRLSSLLEGHLSPDQVGGKLGADAAALHVWELLMLRHGGHCPDAIDGTANTWLAFLDIESFFDRVWRHGLLHQLWTAGVRGKAFLLFLLFCSYLELTTVAVIVEGRTSDSWESAFGLLQGSVLSMLLSALYLSSLQHLLGQAAGRTMDEPRRTHGAHK